MWLICRKLLTGHIFEDMLSLVCYPLCFESTVIRTVFFLLQSLYLDTLF